MQFGIVRTFKGGGPAMLDAAARFVGDLSEWLGTDVYLSVAEDYAGLLAHVVTGATDVGWMPPAVQARAIEMGARLLAASERGGSVTYRSAILVPQDGPLRSVADARGCRAAWVEPNSASGHLTPRADLVAAGAAPSTERFCGSVTAAMEEVLDGEADLCTCYVRHDSTDPGRASDDVRRILGDQSDRLRVLHVTGPIPPDGVVVTARLDGTLARLLSEGLYSMCDRPSGLAILVDLLQAERLVPATDEMVRALEVWARTTPR